jgi:predicted Zn-dependent protease with MMP-like domain
MSEAEHGVDFVQAVRDALESLPEDLRSFMSNVELVVEGEPPPGMPLLGLYKACR